MWKDVTKIYRKINLSSIFQFAFIININLKLVTLRLWKGDYCRPRVIKSKFLHNALTHILITYPQFLINFFEKYLYSSHFKTVFCQLISCFHIYETNHIFVDNANFFITTFRYFNGYKSSLKFYCGLRCSLHFL